VDIPAPAMPVQPPKGWLAGHVANPHAGKRANMGVREMGKDQHRGDLLARPAPRRHSFFQRVSAWVAENKTTPQGGVVM
jgi:hypothetical protein